jgi:hypothetical protein
VLRRIFLLSAAGLASVAALVAIVAVLSGQFGETEGKIFATLAATFVAGSTVIAGVALLARGVSRPLGLLGVTLAAGGYVLWAEQIWAQHDSDTYGKFLTTVLAFTLATLIAVTSRLLLHTPRLVRTLYPATATAAYLAAATLTVMVVRGRGDGWQLFAVLLILALLGEILAPILDRYGRAAAPPERLLGTVAGASVFAVRNGGQVVRVGGEEVALGEGETVVIRPESRAGRGEGAAQG